MTGTYLIMDIGQDPSFIPLMSIGSTLLILGGLYLYGIKELLSQDKDKE